MSVQLPTGAERYGGQIAELVALASEYDPDADGELIRAAFALAYERHDGQLRKSGEAFVEHPLAVAEICARLHQPTKVIVAALLHDAVEDTETSVEEVQERFGEAVATLVEGVTKLSRLHFASREEAQLDTYRRMVLAMARDWDVVTVKLADRLHNLRTIRALPRAKQHEKARETLEIYAPIAHRMGIHSLKSELEDLAFEILHPRKYTEISALVEQTRGDRDSFIDEATRQLAARFEEDGVEAEIRGRAKHLYSIYAKMSRRGKEFNEIFDLVALRLVVGTPGDCYAAIGVLHDLWKPLPGRFKDYITLPKPNGYQSLHTTVIGPRGRPLEIQVRTLHMHQVAEYGVAAHWLYKEGKARKRPGEDWIASVIGEATLGGEGMVDALREDISGGEIFVFTPRGDVKVLPEGATPIDFAYSVHTDVGHRCVGAKVDGRIVPLHYRLRSGEFIEILTSRAERGPSRDWLALVATSRARNKIRQWFQREQRDDYEQRGRDALAQAFRQAGLPHRQITASPLLATVIRDTGFKKADEFYVAIGSGRVLPGSIANKVVQRLKKEEVAAAEETTGVRRMTRGPARTSGQYGVVVEGESDPTLLVRMAKCCNPVPGDPITGYISVGRGITIHQTSCPNARALMRTPERFCRVAWDGAADQPFRVEIAVEAWDRGRLLEDIARTFAEHGCNIVEYGGTVQEGMARNWYVVEIGDVKALQRLLAGLKNVESVFDANRRTPGTAES